MNDYLIYHLPVCIVTLVSDGQAITQLRFGQHIPEDGRLRETPLLQQAVGELEEYCARTRREFTLPLSPQGTAFQQSVWNALCRIPYGETRTYGDIAGEIGRPGAARAVGMANHVNPIAILIPCHRVIGANRSLTGYAGGVELKERLLSLERSQAEESGASLPLF